MSASDQLYFSGETDCCFTANFIKPNMCRDCMKNISKHKKNSISNDTILKALEYSQKGEKIPSPITDITNFSSCGGKLFLGGFKAVLNTEFVVKENLKGVVNTVGEPLFQIFGKKFENSYKSVLSEHDVSCFYVEWEDHTSFDIPDVDLAQVLRFIHERLSTGGSVLVHCAQGKSRSSTVVIAYIMVVMGTTATEAFGFVKERRKMAEPNPRFMEKLKEFETSELRKTLKKDFS